MHLHDSYRSLNILQKISMSLMAALVLLTFIGANLHALLWQSSQWLVSTVLPAVVVELTNEERADNAQAPLVRNTDLDKAAQMKAEHMAKNGYFAHYSPDGVSPWHWFDEVDYVYAHAGENLAVHFTDSSELVDAWMKSPTHRQNIVGSQYTEIGVGTAKGKYDGYNTVFVVQMFGAPGVTTAPAPTPEPEPEPELAINVPEPVTVAPLPVVATEVESAEVAVIEEPEPQPVTVLENTEELTEQPEAQAPSVEPAPIQSEVVVVETPTLATSSGLAIAQITYTEPKHAGGTMASLITQPSAMLQLVYAVLSLIVISLLGLSVVLEARRYHFQQVAYSLLLLFGMGGLLFIHTFLTVGAVIV